VAEGYVELCIEDKVKIAHSIFDDETSTVNYDSEMQDIQNS
jgi:hypothetical protein